VIEVNELQKRRIVQKLEARLGTLHGRTVTLLGLAFTPHKDGLRDDPAWSSRSVCSPRGQQSAR
jgi:UDPglucose 6-dehydrogenase